MEKRPALTKDLDKDTFLNYYYLKEELTVFCRLYHIPTSGGKEDITKRIAHFLDTGEILKARTTTKRKATITKIEETTLIETDFVCSQVHRAFFEEKIGKSFSFPVAFQKWLKTHAGYTYQDAIDAYYMIMEEKKKGKTTIDRQFEYNTYIRAFFEDNHDLSLQDAITCWKYKKQLPGHNKYEKSDLCALR